MDSIKIGLELDNTKRTVNTATTRLYIAMETFANRLKVATKREQGNIWNKSNGKTGRRSNSGGQYLL